MGQQDEKKYWSLDSPRPGLLPAFGQLSYRGRHSFIFAPLPAFWGLSATTPNPTSESCRLQSFMLGNPRGLAFSF